MGFWGSKMSGKVKTGGGVASKANKMFQGGSKSRRRRKKRSGGGSWKIG